MTYTVFLLPNTCIKYPKFIIQLVQSENDSAFVITLDKHMETMCPNAYYLERSYVENGEKTVPHSKIMEKIRKKQPTLVLLDDCFFESNAVLMNEIFKLKKEMNFKLVNVMQLHNAKHSGNIARVWDANCIFAPSWKKEESKRCISPIDNISFYDEDELFYKVQQESSSNDSLHETTPQKTESNPMYISSYLRKYGNFSHVLNITIENSLSEHQKRDTMNKIYYLLNEKEIEKNIFNTNVRIKWRVYNKNNLLRYFTDVAGILGDRAVKEHTKLVLQDIHKEVNKDMFSVDITKPLTNQICIM